MAPDMFKGAFSGLLWVFVFFVVAALSIGFAVGRCGAGHGEAMRQAGKAVRRD